MGVLIGQKEQRKDEAVSVVSSGTHWFYWDKGAESLPVTATWQDIVVKNVLLPGGIR